MTETPGGIFPNISMIDYVLDAVTTDAATRMMGPPTLNASIAHLLVTRTPAHAWLSHPRLNPAWAPKQSDGMDVGTIAHQLLLDGHENGVCIVFADDWRTKVAKDLRDGARARGMTPVLAHKMDVIRVMVEKARMVIGDSEIAGSIRARPEVSVEHTMVWESDGVWHRSRPDWLIEYDGLVVDFKTTATPADPDTWARGPMLAYGYDIQAALAMRGATALLKARNPRAVFLVQETEPPYECALIGLAPQYVDFANQKLDKAITLWRECIATDTWPGYGRRITWVDPPPWAMERWDDRMAVETLRDQGDGDTEAL